VRLLVLSAVRINGAPLAVLLRGDQFAAIAALPPPSTTAKRTVAYSVKVKSAAKESVEVTIADAAIPLPPPQQQQQQQQQAVLKLGREHCSHPDSTSATRVKIVQTSLKTGGLPTAVPALCLLHFEAGATGVHAERA
jgi:hypothetical protein